jgi:hypothetical protein
MPLLDAGIVHQDIERRMLGGEPAHEVGAALCVRDVARVGNEAGHALARLRQGVLAAATGDDSVALPDEALGERQSDAAATTGDEDRVRIGHCRLLSTACERVCRVGSASAHPRDPASGFAVSWVPEGVRCLLAEAAGLTNRPALFRRSRRNPGETSCKRPEAGGAKGQGLRTAFPAASNPPR